jgi:hypothetical protein
MSSRKSLFLVSSGLGVLLNIAVAEAQLSDQAKAERDQRLLRKYDANKNGKLDPEDRANSHAFRV